MIISELLSDKDKFINIIKNDWLSCAEAFPDFLPKFSEEMKRNNESSLSQMIDALQVQLKKSHHFPFMRKRWQKNTFQLIISCLLKDEILGISRYMDNSEINRFIDELKVFLLTLRSFSPELSFEEVGQATRNYIVYAMFKKLHGLDTGYSHAAFGYSMLYPFTDNYIDNNSLTEEEKKAYNRLIHDKLEGKAPTSYDLHQKKTCDLLQFIEDEYPRDRYPYIFRMLLMMLDAQEQSLLQQDKKFLLTYQDRLDISIYKGGISVLIDRILVNKELSQEDLMFYLGFGFFLQLADDLQDIGEDLAQGHSNLFTHEITCHQEEKRVNRLFHYLHFITTAYPADDPHFKEFLLNSSYLLIATSVIRSRQFFTDDYLKHLEEYLPFRISYLEELMSNRIELSEMKVQNQYMSLIDELIR